MAVLVWSDRDSVLGNTIRSGRRVVLSAEEYRAEAEALDQKLDALLDMAWHALTIITEHKHGKPRFNAFEQVWVLGRTVHISEVMRQEAMQGEVHSLLWEALTPKAWYGIRHGGVREPRWRELIPVKRKKWQEQPPKNRHYDFLDVGYWLREQQLHDAGEVFHWKFNNARELYVRSSLRSVELRKAVLYWMRRQTPEVREALAKPTRSAFGFELIPKVLQRRFPAKGPGSALLPQHYPKDELRAIVCDALDTALDAHFPNMTELRLP